ALRPDFSQLVQDLLGSRPNARVLGQAGRDQRLEPGGHLAEVRLGVGHPVEQVGGALLAERAAPGGGEGQHRPQGEDVAGRSDLVPERLLRGEVAGRAQEHSRGGERGRSGRAGDAEVDHPRAVGAQQHVGRFQVPVHQTSAVDRAERLGQPGSQRAHRLFRKRAVLGHRLVEGWSGHVLGGQPGLLGFGVGVHDGRGPQAADRSGHRDFAAEPFPELGVFGEIGPDHFDRYDAPAAGAPQEHAAHGPASQPAQHLVVANVVRVAGQQRLHDPVPSEHPLLRFATRAYGVRVRAFASPWGSLLRRRFPEQWSNRILGFIPTFSSATRCGYDPAHCEPEGRSGWIEGRNAVALKAQSSPGQPAVALNKVSKRFPGVLAVSEVTLQIFPGEVHVFAGENGAGKSTLMKMISQAEAPSSGRIEFAGKPVSFQGPGAARRLGVAMVHQEFALAPDLSVAENLFIGHEPGRGGWISRSSERRRARELLARAGLQVDPDRRVGTLSTAEQQRVEIAKALAVDAKVLILDEPTASLTEQETQELFGIIRELTAQGIAVLYISHRLDEIFEIGDRVTVMRDGAVVATKPVSELDEAKLVRLMVGRNVENLYPRSERSPGEVRLQVRGLTRGTAVRDVSLDVRAGEILGLAGLVGSGRGELARAVFVAELPESGTL